MSLRTTKFICREVSFGAGNIYQGFSLQRGDRRTRPPFQGARVMGPSDEFQSFIQLVVCEERLFATMRLYQF